MGKVMVFDSVVKQCSLTKICDPYALMGGLWRAVIGRTHHAPGASVTENLINYFWYSALRIIESTLILTYICVELKHKIGTLSCWRVWRHQKADSTYLLCLYNPEMVSTLS